MALLLGLFDFIQWNSESIGFAEELGSKERWRKFVVVAPSLRLGKGGAYPRFQRESFPVPESDVTGSGGTGNLEMHAPTLRFGFLVWFSFWHMSGYGRIRWHHIEEVHYRHYWAAMLYAAV